MQPIFEYNHYSHWQLFYYPPSGGVDLRCGCGLGWCGLRGWGAWGQVPIPGYPILRRTDWTSVFVCLNLAGNTAYVK
eukprot:669139-Rhodomonas_salina.1